MKTSTTIKIIIITFFLILSKVSVGQTSSKKEVKKSTSNHSVKKSTQSPSLAGSKRGILPTMTVTTVSKSYLV